jgi:carboxylesterase type B
MILLALTFALGALVGAWIAFAVEGREHTKTLDAWQASNEHYCEMLHTQNESWAKIARDQSNRWADTWKASAVALFFAELREWERTR